MGKVKIEIFFRDETFWLSQKRLAELFGVDIRTISEHLKNIFKSSELDDKAIIRKFRTTAEDGKNYLTSFYHLDAIIAVGYRVNSHQATQFRIWATQTLREFIIKGFAIDDERLKRAGGDGYFEELLGRIRDIRSSEKIFWKKVLEIYATSIDYDGNTEEIETLNRIVTAYLEFAELQARNRRPMHMQEWISKLDDFL